MFGGLVGIHFATPLRGWYYQVGLGWQTNNGGVTWKSMQFPVTGSLVALSSSGNDAWALIDVCPIGALSCPQAMGRATLFHAVMANHMSWKRVGKPLPAGTYGGGTLYPNAEGHSVVISLGYQTYVRSLQSARSVPSIGCGPVGVLSDGSLAGICGGGGGGDASVSKIAVSADSGASWHPLVDGPPSASSLVP